MKTKAMSLVVLGLLAVNCGSAPTADPPKSAQAQPAAASRSVFFLRDVMPLVTRLGCNSVQCHGAPLGKGGMPLSMFGGDAEGDYETIVKDQRGTRINRMDPARSLLLLKVSGSIPHGGAAEDPARLRGIQDAACLDRARGAVQRREAAEAGLRAGPSAGAGVSEGPDAATCGYGGLCRRHEDRTSRGWPFSNPRTPRWLRSMPTARSRRRSSAPPRSWRFTCGSRGSFACGSRSRWRLLSRPSQPTTRSTNWSSPT